VDNESKFIIYIPLMLLHDREQLKHMYIKCPLIHDTTTFVLDIQILATGTLVA